MRKVPITLIIAALLTLGASSATSAFAAEWLEDGNPITVAKEALAGATVAISLGDMKLGVTLLCTTDALGKVGPGAASTVSSVSLTCSIDLGCTTLDNVTAANLGWAGTVVASGAEFLNKLTEGTGKAAPGYLVECVAGGVLLDDVCTRAESFQTLLNGAEGVTASFNEEETANCSLGGAGSGLVSGSTTLVLLNGLTLTVS